MDKSEIGFLLSELRGNAKLTGNLGPFAIQSIEGARHSYPVGNLITYCNDYNIGVTIIDHEYSQRFEIKSADDVHHAIKVCIVNRKSNFTRLNREIGRNYTYKDKTGTGKPLSIDMLLLILNNYNCDIKFTKIKVK